MDTPNIWPSNRAAKTYWLQKKFDSHRRLVKDTLDSCNPGANESWLDLGCGSGALTRGIWSRTDGTVAEVVGLDVAAANETIYHSLRDELKPSPGDKIRFVCHDFSDGLGLFKDARFDHVVSGLAIPYAQSYCETTHRWTRQGYDRLLAEVCRIMRPGGRFVFSAPIQNPSWMLVTMASIGSIARSVWSSAFLKAALRMIVYGRWLKQQARIGRFHYLPAEAVERQLMLSGFESVEHRKSFAGQAYVFRAIKSGAGAALR